VPDFPRSGTYAYGWAASGFVEEARAAAAPALLPAVAGDPYDDIMSPTFVSYRRERRAAECLDGALTILALVSSQALYSPSGRHRGTGSAARLRALALPAIVDIKERKLSEEATRLQGALSEAALTGSLSPAPTSAGEELSTTSTKGVS